jgi:hypothetical protein
MRGRWYGDPVHPPGVVFQRPFSVISPAWMTPAKRGASRDPAAADASAHVQKGLQTIG